jgi:hypothetical protein
VTALIVVEGAAILLLGLLVVGLLRSHAEILRQLHELGADRDGDIGVTTPVDLSVGGSTGSAAQDVSGLTPRGEAAAIGVSGTGHDTLLAFLSSGCLTCAGFWQALGRTDNLGLPTRTRVIAVTKSPGDESQAAVRDLAPAGRTVVMSTQAWQDYEVPGSPYFVHVSGPNRRVVGEGTASTWEQVVSLVARANEDRMARTARHQDDEPAGAARIDAELMAAGVLPGDPTLYPTAPPVSDERR